MSKVKNTTSFLNPTSITSRAITRFPVTSASPRGFVIAAGYLSDGKYGYSLCDESYVNGEYVYANEQSAMTKIDNRTYGEFLERSVEIVGERPIV